MGYPILISLVVLRVSATADDDIPFYRRLITLYQTVHDELHARSGQIQGPLKLQCIRTDTEIVMGWVRLTTSINI